MSESLMDVSEIEMSMDPSPYLFRFSGTSKLPMWRLCFLHLGLTKVVKKKSLAKQTAFQKTTSFTSRKVGTKKSGRLGMAIVCPLRGAGRFGGKLAAHAATGTTLAIHHHLSYDRAVTQGQTTAVVLVG